MNATDDGDEPMGESPEVTMPRVARLADRKSQALNEIRALCGSPFDVLQVELYSVDDLGSTIVDTPVVAVADILAIMERNRLC